MFGISGIEFAIIIVFAFLIFGPDKLPKVIKDVSHIWEQLKGLRQQADQVIKAEVVEPLKDIESSINPFVAEGKSATDMLASRLGLKPDKKASEEKKEGEAAKEESPVAKSAEASEGDTGTATAGQPASAQATTAATETSPAVATLPAAEISPAVATSPATETQPPLPQPKPKLKPKTESFAEKKAAMERALRERQKAEAAKKEAASASPVDTAPSPTETQPSAAQEPAGE